MDYAVKYFDDQTGIGYERSSMVLAFCLTSFVAIMLLVLPTKVAFEKLYAWCLAAALGADDEGDSGPPTKSSISKLHDRFVAAYVASGDDEFPPASIPQSSSLNNPSGGALSKEEIESRIVCPQETNAATIGKVQIRYAYASQRGYYPDELDKDNQDAFVIKNDFAGIPGDYLFGVFDGHGKEGDKCALFTKAHLPDAIASCLRAASRKKKEKKLHGASRYSSLPIDLSPQLSSKEVELACGAAHVKVNEAMHVCKTLDDSLSGTTSITILFHGNNMTICNVGDSRAIIGRMVSEGTADVPQIPGQAWKSRAAALDKKSEEGAKPVLTAYPLSSDHTPYRKDERERVKKFGARIMSMDQIEGLEPIHENWGDVILGEEIDEVGDPPRIWSPNGQYPGTAFTRSIGDRVAKELGVVPEPEMLTMTLTPYDVYIVIASDGVFEFLTNQSVVDMCANFVDPLEACRAVVAMAYGKWVEHEVRTDDITVIALFIDDVDDAPAEKEVEEGGVDNAAANADRARANDDEKNVKHAGKRPSMIRRVSRLLSSTGGMAPVELQPFMVEGVRPVRRTTVRNSSRRKSEMKTRSAAEDTDFDMLQYVSQKSDHEKARIEASLKASFLFQHISPASRELLFSVMEKVKVRAGDCVIRQGGEGDRFYIVDNGRFEVRIKGAVGSASSAEEDSEGGKVVHVYTSGAGSHPSFGELALMYSMPISASVIATTDGQLWALRRNIFRKVLMRRSGRKELMTALRKVDILRSLSILQSQILAGIMTPVDYEKDECIMKQGEIGETLFIIVSGTVSCTEKDILGAAKVINTLRENDYFGERGLLKMETRAFSAISNGKTKCLSISRSHFEQIVGNLTQIIEEDRIKKEERSKALSGTGPPLLGLQKFGVVMEDDLSTTVLCKNSEDKHTLKVLWKKGVVANNAQDAVMREIDLLKSLSKVKSFSDCQYIAAIKSTYVDKDCLYVLYEQPICCNLSTFAESFTDGVFDELSAKHIAMCVMIALETVHSQMVVYRGISPDTISITSDGSALLHDFHNARQNPDGNVTICGTPEFLAPEVVLQQGHGFPSDYWTLGVLIYYMLVGKTPFEASSEIDVYAKICRHTVGSITVGDEFSVEAGKAKVSASCLDFINALICPDPKKRLGGRSTRVEEWFTEEEWLVMRSEKICKFASLQLAVTMAVKDETTDKVQENEYLGSNEWCEHF